MAKYLYEVTDALTGKILFRKLTRGELSKALDMPPKYIHLFTEPGSLPRAILYLCQRAAK